MSPSDHVFGPLMLKNPALIEHAAFQVHWVAAEGMIKVMNDLKLDAMVVPSWCWLTTAFPCVSG